MSRYLSILRGINVGGSRIILMKDLKQLYTNYGFRCVESYIQSGNLVFESEMNITASELEKNLQELIAKTFGFEVPVLIRSFTEWTDIVTNNPFLKEENIDINSLHLTCLKALPTSDLLEEIKAFQDLQVRQAHCEPDRFEIIGREVFVYCASGYGKTKFTNSFFETKLKTQATTRNWKTVIHLYELAKSNI